MHNNNASTSHSAEIVSYTTTLQTREKINIREGSIVDLYPIILKYIYTRNVKFIEFNCKIKCIIVKFIGFRHINYTATRL